MDPIFWLGLSILLVAVSIAAVLWAAVPAMKELGRAAQSAEKLFDTLNRELPPTLEAIRLTSLEITELTDDITDGVQGASNIVQQVDGSVSGVKSQAQQAKVTTKSVMAGMKAAWKSLTTEEPQPPNVTLDDNPVPLTPTEATPRQATPAESLKPEAPPSASKQLEPTDRMTTPQHTLPPPEVIQSRLAGYENNGRVTGHLSAAQMDAEILLSNAVKPADAAMPTDE